MHKVFLIRPGEAPKLATVDSGAFAEALGLSSGMLGWASINAEGRLYTVFCSDTGLLDGDPYNLILGGHVFFGPVLISRYDEEGETVDVDVSDGVILSRITQSFADPADAERYRAEVKKKPFTITKGDIFQ